MNRDMIIEQLEKWEENEIFYRDFYQFTNGNSRNEEELQNFLEEKNPSEEERSMVLHPSENRQYVAEEQYFHGDCNVVLTKHPRYVPYFMHRHAFFEMIYVLSGKCTQVFEDCEISLKKGDLCLMAPEVCHGIGVFDDSVVINILIRHSTFLDIFLNTIRDKSQISLFFLGNMYEKDKTRYLLYHTGGDALIRNYILDMYREQLHMDRYSDRITCSLLTIFFAQLTRLYGRTVYVSDFRSNKLQYGSEMVSYIVEHYDSITLEGLAEYFHFSVPHCSRMIKKTAGISFSDLLTKVRLQQGENMLVHTQMNIADISIRVGYKNPETFIRCFSRYYHMSPTQFRKKQNAQTFI